jgi:exodeoxyribonuclease-3
LGHIGALQQIVVIGACGFLVLRAWLSSKQVEPAPPPKSARALLFSDEREMKLITWNINSVRLRLDLVVKLLKKEQPDMLCLQETKVINDLFPRQAFEKLGYVHQAIHGQKGYHGVATLSKRPFAKSDARQFCGKDDTRHLVVTFENAIELHNFYVPAGADIPDPVANPKFAHKLDFARWRACS